MANCHCKKCGAEASSKCPYCRSVFMNDQREAALSWILKRGIKETNGQRWLEVSWFLSSDEDLVEGLKKLRNTLTSMDDAYIKQYCCDHTFEFKPGCESTIGCGCK